MNLNTGFFPPHGFRRKHTTTTSYNLPLNNQQHHHTLSLSSARSSMESTTNGSESFLPSISTTISNNDSHKPYRQNDFANNHLFIAKRKLARFLVGQPTRNLQATSDLIHLFDQQEPKRKNRNINKSKLQENLINKTPPIEQDIHLSVVNLTIQSSQPSTQSRDPLSTLLRHRRSQLINSPSKPTRSSINPLNLTNKQNFQSTSLNTFTDNIECDESLDNDNISDGINSSINPFDSSLLCVKSIIPSAGPQPTNHHLLQHR